MSARLWCIFCLYIALRQARHGVIGQKCEDLFKQAKANDRVSAETYEVATNVLYIRVPTYNMLKSH